MDFTKILFSAAVWQKYIPIGLGYFPIGIACGVFSEKMGFSLLQTFIMSAFVYAGSAQFIAIAMLNQLTAVSAVVLTVMVVNLRLILFSATLLEFLRHKSNKFLAVFAQGVTDEVFAVNYQSFKEGNWSETQALALNILANATWAISSAIGFIASEFINIDLELVGFALVAMFIGLWANCVLQSKLLLTGLISGILAILLSQVLDYKLHLVVSTVIAASIATYIELNTTRGKKHG